MVRSLFAGMVATAVISAIIYLNGRADIIPDFPILAEIQAFNTRIGLPASEQAAWITHAVIGIVLYSALFAVLEPLLPGNGLSEGLTFGLVAWLAMMVVFAPLAGNEIFYQDLDPILIATTFGLHMIYGAVLGVSFASISRRSD